MMKVPEEFSSIFGDNLRFVEIPQTLNSPLASPSLVDLMIPKYFWVILIVTIYICAGYAVNVTTYTPGARAFQQEFLGHSVKPVGCQA